MFGAFFGFLPLIYGKDSLRGLFMCEEKKRLNCISSVSTKIFVVFLWCDYGWGSFGKCVTLSYIHAHKRHCLLNKRTMKVVLWWTFSYRK